MRFSTGPSPVVLLGTDLLNALKSKNPNWPTLGPENYKLAAARWTCSFQLGGYWAKTTSAYLSLPAQVGAPVKRSKEAGNRGIYVLKANAYGFFG